MLLSWLAQFITNAQRCSMGDVSFQGTDPPQVRTVGVTHVLGPLCYPCARFVPVQGAEPWGVARRPRLPKKLVSGLRPAKATHEINPVASSVRLTAPSMQRYGDSNGNGHGHGNG